MSGRCGAALVIPQLQMRATTFAGVRLGMKTSIEGIFILAPAAGTHGELTHCGVLPVVRNGVDDGKAGTTVSALRKRIPVSAIRRIQNFFHAVCARRDIRENENRRNS